MESRIEAPNRQRGAARDVSKYAELTRKIPIGEDLLAEFVIARFEYLGSFRTKAWAALGRSAAYLATI